MSARTLTIDPFAIPGGTSQDTELTIALIDSDGKRIMATTSGATIIDQTQVDVTASGASISIWPTSELTPIYGYGSAATGPYYAVTLRNRSTEYEHIFRCQVATGGAMSWSDLVAGAV